jgi:hypothetical protein
MWGRGSLWDPRSAMTGIRVAARVSEGTRTQDGPPVRVSQAGGTRGGHTGRQLACPHTSETDNTRH